MMTEEDYNYRTQVRSETLRRHKANAVAAEHRAAREAELLAQEKLRTESMRVSLRQAEDAAKLLERAVMEGNGGGGLS